MHSIDILAKSDPGELIGSIVILIGSISGLSSIFGISLITIAGRDYCRRHSSLAFNFLPTNESPCLWIDLSSALILISVCENIVEVF